MASCSIDQKFRDWQKSISNAFLISAFVVLIGFVIMQYTLKDVNWGNFVWIQIYGLIFALIGLVIEIDRLKFELSKKG